MIISEYRPEELVALTSLSLFMANATSLEASGENFMMNTEVLVYARDMRWVISDDDGTRLTALGERQVCTFQSWVQGDFVGLAANGLMLRAKRMAALRKGRKNVRSARVPKKPSEPVQDTEGREDGLEGESSGSGL